MAKIDGRAQVIVPQGDGWIRSFNALTGELIWKFDINPKESTWRSGGASPAIAHGRMYLRTHQALWAIAAKVPVEINDSPQATWKTQNFTGGW